MCCSPFPELIRATVQAERLRRVNGFGPEHWPWLNLHTPMR